jgi:3-oxoadipate CoA-transferase beta subunit
MMRGGHLDICVLGAFQVSAMGDIANWHTGAPGRSGGGRCDGSGHRCQANLRHDGAAHQERESKLVERCTYPLTGIGCISRVYTDLGTFSVGPQGAGIIDLVPGFSIEEARRSTGLQLDATGRIAA